MRNAERACTTRGVAGEISQSATGYALGNLLTSLIAGWGGRLRYAYRPRGSGFPLLWALWVALVRFLRPWSAAPWPVSLPSCSPQAVADRGHRHCGRVYRHQQIENHVLNPVVMSRTVNVNPLLVLLSLLVVISIGDWGWRLFRQSSRRCAHPGRGAPPGHRSGTTAGHGVGGIASKANCPPNRGSRDPASKDRSIGRELRDSELELTRVELKAPTFDLSGKPRAWPRSGTCVFHSP